jgi:hypothetical protein
MAVKATRRRFMALLGFGAASGPLAVKTAADAEIMQLTGTRVAESAIGSLVSGAGGAGAPISPSPEIYAKSIIAASDYIRVMGLPAALDARLRDEARWNDRLDPDIACKRSWSMSVKFAAQRQHNYERALERMHTAAWHQRGRATLKTLLGFEWPW